MEEAPSGRAGSALYVGGWYLCQGRSGEGKGCSPGHRGGTIGWAEGNPGRRARVQGIYGELVRGAARPQRTWLELSSAGYGRRQSWHLGRFEEHLPQKLAAAL